MSNEVRTYESHPWDGVVGKRYRGYSNRDNVWKTWFCDMYDPRCGYWMQATDRDEDRVCVSERAIDRTFYTVWVLDDGNWEFTAGGYSYRHNKQEVLKL